MLFIKVSGITINILGILFIGLLLYQYIKVENRQIYLMHDKFQKYLIIIIHMLSLIVLLDVREFDSLILIFAVISVGLLILVNIIIDIFFQNTLLPLWRISQFMLVIGWVMLARLNIEIGIKQVTLAAIAYISTFLVITIYKKINHPQLFGVPVLILSYILLLFTNVSINGSRNWMSIGSFSFQPSEVVKVFYIIFLAAVLSRFATHRHRALFGSGLAIIGILLIQIKQVDLGSVLIFYVIFILMSYVYTTNRYYIVGGSLITIIGSFFAYARFPHVRVRIETWLNPWTSMDNQGYQVTQSLFAIGSGKFFGTGLSLGQPYKIPVVTTDFIYSAIVEEFGLILGLIILVLWIIFLIEGIRMLNRTKLHFDFLLGGGLLILLLFQTFLIIGGVTKMVPLTGVTLPFISYGGSSLVMSFIILGMLQGIYLKEATKTMTMRMIRRNKPFRRIIVLFIVMFVILGSYMIYFTTITSEDILLDPHNPRIENFK